MITHTFKDLMCMENPAQKAGLREGDLILSIDSKEVSTNEEVAAAVQDCGGKPLTLEVQRKNMASPWNSHP